MKETRKKYYEINGTEYTLERAASGDWVVSTKTYGKEKQYFRCDSRMAAVEHILSKYELKAERIEESDEEERWYRIGATKYWLYLSIGGAYYVRAWPDRVEKEHKCGPRVEALGFILDGYEVEAGK